MWAVTGWVIATWLKLTVLLAIGVGVAWLVFGGGSGWFWTLTAAAAALDLYLARQLTREWGHEVRLTWWGTR